MKATRLSQAKKISASDLRGGGVKTVKTPNKPKATNEGAAGIGQTPSSIEPVAERFPALEEQEVMLEFLAPEANQVAVAGKFNNWDPVATPLKNNGLGEWVARLMLRSGQYEYRFVVDGQWLEDPEAMQRVVNPHGGFNSVLTVPLAVRTSIL
jgi:hypothetical protein